MIEVCNIGVMKPLLAEHGFHFSKAKGQNFLIAPWVPERIAEDSGVDETAGVLEIGPGIGPSGREGLRCGGGSPSEAYPGTDGGRVFQFGNFVG